MAMHTVESIRALLHRNPVSKKSGRTAVECAIIELYKLQTRSEKASGQTHNRNGQGFNIYDAPLATKMAAWIRAGNHLSGWWSMKALTLTCKYAGQLVSLANQLEIRTRARKLLADAHVEVSDEQFNRAVNLAGAEKLRQTLGIE